MKIIEWNLNFGSDREAKPADFVKKELNAINADIVVATEVVFNNHLEELFTSLNYKCFASVPVDQILANQVVIAVKSEINAKEIPVSQINDKPLQLPDLVHVEIDSPEKKFQVIGCRVRIGSLSDEEYKKRARQFEMLSKYLSHFDEAIVLGDFNSGMIKAPSNKPYSEVKSAYSTAYKLVKNARVKCPNPLRFYNFHLMKEILEKNCGYIMEEIMGTDSSWGLSCQNGEINFGSIKNDQVLTKGIELTSASYNWDYLKKYNNYLKYILMLEQPKKYGNKIDHGYPDHAIVQVEI